MVHPTNFTVPIIEGEAVILRAPAHPEALAELADWNYAGNSYYNFRALRLRAFVLCALDMMMLDDLLENGEETAKPNQDRLASAILRFANTYPKFSQAIPANVREAYLVVLKKFVRRALDHGPKSLPKTLGLFTIGVPALAVAAKQLNDPAITKEVEEYARKVFTDPRFFRAAGYFPFGGTLDSFNGFALTYAIWGAAAGDWPFARDAIARAHRLRAHLTLPEPDGFRLGPSHMGGLTSSDPINDQWNMGARAWSAAILTDEAACLTTMPDEAAIRKGAAKAASTMNEGIHEMSRAGLNPKPWTGTSAAGTNVGYYYYAKDYYTRRAALERTDLARLPVLRDKDFVERFTDEFLVAKTAGHALIIHTGPITDPADPGAGLGFGGGALSAFWTRATGSVILGRGIGSWSPMYPKMFEGWRSLPTHAVTGVTAAGKVFTSAHIPKPETTFEVKDKDKTYAVVAHGLIPSARQGEALFTETLDYTRRFESTASGVRITTTVKADSPDAVAELYETLPVFLREAGEQRKVVPTSIEFQVGGKWSPATEALTANVSAARLRRFDGAVDAIFDQPATVKLAPPWADTYMSHAACRNLLIDLLGNGGEPAVIKDVRKVSYQIQPVAK